MNARPPRVRPKIAPAWLGAVAALSLGGWLVVERSTQGATHPRYAEMLAAARTVQAASQVLATAKEARGLMAPPEADPNRTGMIGPEYSTITTSLGSPDAKRTTTNPDFAAGLVRVIATLDLAPGTPVVIVVSGSFVGGNIAAIAAVEALSLQPIVIASLTASMWGATDPAFSWLDMATLLRNQGVIRTGTTAAVLGGDGAVGGGLDPEAVAALQATADRDGVPVVRERPLRALIDSLLARIDQALGPGRRPGLVINVGGALIGLGSCRESYEFPPGLRLEPASCHGGTAGVAMRLSEMGVPFLQVINIRRLAAEWGLPFDPVPLPVPGNNAAIYGPVRGGAG